MDGEEHAASGAGVRAYRAIMKINVNSYRTDKYYPRVVTAVAKILSRSDVVSPVEVLMEMGNISKKNARCMA